MSTGVSSGSVPSASSQVSTGVSSGSVPSASSHVSTGVSTGTGSVPSASSQVSTGVSSGSVPSVSSHVSTGVSSGSVPSASSHVSTGVSSGSVPSGSSEVSTGVSLGSVPSASSHVSTGVSSGSIPSASSQASTGVSTGTGSVPSASSQVSTGVSSGSVPSASSHVSTGVSSGTGSVPSVSSHVSTGVSSSSVPSVSSHVSTGVSSGSVPSGSSQVSTGVSAGSVPSASSQVSTGVSSGSVPSGSSQVSTGVSSSSVPSASSQVSTGVSTGTSSVPSVSSYLSTGVSTGTGSVPSVSSQGSTGVSSSSVPTGSSQVSTGVSSGSVPSASSQVSTGVSSVSSQVSTGVSTGTGSVPSVSSQGSTGVSSGSVPTASSQVSTGVSTGSVSSVSSQVSSGVSTGSVPSVSSQVSSGVSTGSVPSISSQVSTGFSTGSAPLSSSSAQSMVSTFSSIPSTSFSRRHYTSSTSISALSSLPSSSSHICVARPIDIDTDVLMDDFEYVIGGNGQRPRSPTSQALLGSGSDFEFPDGATKLTLIFELQINETATLREVEMKLVYAEKINVKVYESLADVEPVFSKMVTGIADDDVVIVPMNADGNVMKITVSKRVGEPLLNNPSVSELLIKACYEGERVCVHNLTLNEVKISGPEGQQGTVPQDALASTGYKPVADENNNVMITVELGSTDLFESELYDIRVTLKNAEVGDSVYFYIRDKNMTQVDKRRYPIRQSLQTIVDNYNGEGGSFLQISVPVREGYILRVSDLLIEACTHLQTTTPILSSISSGGVSTSAASFTSGKVSTSVSSGVGSSSVSSGRTTPFSTLSVTLSSGTLPVSSESNVSSSSQVSTTTPHICENATIGVASNDIRVKSSSTGFALEPRQALLGSENSYSASEFAGRETLTLEIFSEMTPEIYSVSFATENVASATIKILPDEGLLPIHQETQTDITDLELVTFYVPEGRNEAYLVEITLRRVTGVTDAITVSSLSVDACYEPEEICLEPLTENTVILSSGVTSESTSLIDAFNMAPENGWIPDLTGEEGTVAIMADTGKNYTEVFAVTLTTKGFDLVNIYLEQNDGTIVDSREYPITTPRAFKNIFVNFDGQAGARLRFDFTVNPDINNRMVRGLIVESCSQPIPETTTTPASTTPSASTPGVCIFTDAIFERLFDDVPSQDRIGYIDIDGDNAFSISEESFYINDDIPADAVVHILCKNCTCVDMEIQCLEEETCTECVFTEWSEWTQCSKECDVGISTRTREVIGDVTCDMLTYDARDCNIDPCTTTTPPLWTTWSPWTPCTSTDPCIPGMRLRTRFCDDNDCDGDTLELEACQPDGCEEEVCDSDDEEWSNCSNVCHTITCKDFRLSSFCDDNDVECVPGCKCKDGMVRDNNGVCINEEECPCYTPDGTIVPFGATIEGDNECEICLCQYDGTYNCSEVENCCQLGDWGEWGDCHAECGEGLRHRYRNVRSGSGCELDDLVEEEPCNSGDCAPVCVVGGVEYGLGDRIMESQCEVCYCERIAVVGGKVCYPKEEAIVDGNWGNWTQWTACDSDCQGGVKRRYRACNQPTPQCGGDVCEGEPMEELPCNDDVSCCEVGPWSSWDDCSEECDGGVRNRTRLFNDVNDVNREECDDVVLTEEEPCNEDPCNTTCEVSMWTEWTNCSAVCDGGVQTRTRDILNATEDCDLLRLNDSRPCNEDPCECQTNAYYTVYRKCDVHTCAELVYGVANPASCEEEVYGCVCEDGFFVKEGECVRPETCHECVHENVTYQNGEIIPNEENPCYEYVCVSGEVLEQRICEIPICDVGETLSYDDDVCCPKCEPAEEAPDKCSLKVTPKKRFVSGNCISDQEHVVTYCAGTCGVSRSEPRLIMNIDDELSVVSNCECCAGIPGDRINITMICTEGSNTYTRYGHITPMKECECNVCIGGKPDEEDIGI